MPLILKSILKGSTMKHTRRITAPRPAYIRLDQGPLLDNLERLLLFLQSFAQPLFSGKIAIG